MFRHSFDHRNDDCVAKLLVGTRIRNLDDEWLPSASVKSHQPGTFPGCQATWRSALSAIDQDFGAILVVTSGKGPGDILFPNESISETVSHGPMFRRVILEINPEVFAQRIPLGNLSFVSDCEGWLFGLCSVLRVENIAESGPLRRLFNRKSGEIETRLLP